MLRPRIVKYHMNIPMDINEVNTSRSIRPKEGAFQMSKGSIGDLANFDSQIAKPTKWRTDTINST